MGLLSRRGFLKGSGAALALSFVNFDFRALEAAADTSGSRTGSPEYADFRDVYRRNWTWDRVARSTHNVNCAYQKSCAWNIYVKDGIVWREEQVGDYPQTNASVPDFNPRGCQKGACYSARSLAASRLLHPLQRVGARGEGRWKRVSWDEALREIADTTIDAIIEEGPGSVIWDMGSAITNGCLGLGLTRTVGVLDTPMLEANTEIGDHYPGATVTTGKLCYLGSMDDLHYSDLILIWGGNPIYTQIPNAHFILEARYNGARVVTIAPDYNASSIHSDEWVPVNVGTDAALGLSMAHVMVEEDLFDRRFVAEQTDLPLLVRTDTRRFLTQADLEEGGADDIFYVLDRTTGAISEVSQRTLTLGDIDPVLEAELDVDVGESLVGVTTVFSLLRKHLAAYTPEAASKITGTRPEQIRSLARTIARARAATTITQTNFSKFYHGMEMERAEILVMTLAGHIGKKGAGITAFPLLSPAGPEALAMASGKLLPKLGVAAVGLESVPAMLKLKLQGYTMEMIIGELGREEYLKGRFPSAALFLYRHGGLRELYGSAKRWDPDLPREFEDYFEEALEKGWQVVHETPPRILLEAGGNLFRRVRGYDRMIDNLLPKLDLLVTLDWRMSNTALHSDYVLPAAGWYEKDDFVWGTTAVPFCHVTTKAVEPLGDSKDDWVFHCLFLKTLQQRAIERGISEFKDRAGEVRRLDRVYDEFTFEGRFTENNVEEFLEEMLSLTSNLDGVGWQELSEKGYAPYTGVGMSVSQMGHATDFEPGETLTPNTWHTDKKQPWPTHTRRMQFYIDHDLFLELGEELPVHKDNPRIGGDYPLEMTGGHTRWSVHSSWRDEETLLRLQRGEPVLTMGADDARERGIRDGETARVYNDVGSFEVLVKIASAVRPSQVIVYHAWEPFQFRKGSHQTLIPSPLNPINLAGGYFQLRPSLLMGSPGCSDRGTRVEIERVDA
jgi:DMSO reductase family type II enzyme molybdopterin subunit